MILAALVYLPGWAILAFGVVLVAGHNLLDPIQMDGTATPALIWYLLHQLTFVAFGPDRAVYFHYPLIPLVGLMALVALAISGRHRSEYILNARAFMSGALADFGFALPAVYLVWALVMLGMYPLCKWYRAYKKRHPEIRLLRYI